MLEHDYEPTPGMPQVLPDGEQLQWRGRPGFASLALSTFHVRKLALYFVALIGLHLLLGLGGDAGAVATLSSAVAYTALAAVALGLMTLYAWLVARATMYTITNKRVVVRTGVAVPVTINLPFSRIDRAALRSHRDGSGDIALVTEAASRVSWVLLWPLVKPWRWLRVQPVLRGIVDAEAVAAILAAQLQRAVSDAEPAAAAAQQAETKAPRGKRRFRPYPTLPLAAASSLVVIALVGVAWTQFSGGKEQAAVAEPVAEAVALYFEDRDDGSVVVIDASDGRTLDVLAAGTNGFLRSSMRTFVRARKSVDAGREQPFVIKRTVSGRLLLSDPATQRHIDLRAFGQTNADAFGRLLSLAASDEVAKTPDVLEVGDATTAVALTSQEVNPQ